MPSAVRSCLLALLPLLAAGCGASRPAGEEAPPQEPGAGNAAAPVEAPEKIHLPRKVDRPPPPPRLSWPPGFRVLESGSLGPEVRPAFWWTLDAGDEDPGVAVERVREVLARRFGEERVPGAPALDGDGATVVFVGKAHRASITAHRTDGRTVVRIVLARGVE